MVNRIAGAAVGSNMVDGPSSKRLFATILIAVGLIQIRAVAIPPAPPDQRPMVRADEKQKAHRTAQIQPPMSHSKVRAAPRNNGPLFSCTTFTNANFNAILDARADEFLICFRRTASQTDRAALMSKHKIEEARKKTDRLSRIRWNRMRVPPGKSLAEMVSLLGRESAVEKVEPNVVTRSLAVASNGPTADAQWNLDIINAKKAWGVTRGDPSVTVAVVDSGIDLTHPCLKGKINAGYNFIDDSEYANDDNGHGTQIAGIVAASRCDGSGIDGVAPGCRIAPLKVLDSGGFGTVADLAEAIVYAADNRFPIINISLGITYDSPVLRAAVEYARSSGAMIVAAAGNNADGVPVFPAAYPMAIAVGAVDATSQPCAFSHRGACVDLVAPGESVLTTDLMGALSLSDGTSMAAAHVSGAAALILSVEPGLSGPALEAAIRNATSDLGGPGWDEATGLGHMDCFAAITGPGTNPNDIGVVSAELFPRMPYPGQETRLIVEVRNHNGEHAAGTTLVLRQQDVVVSSLPVPDLAGNEVRTLEMTWTPPAERGETNMTLSVELVPLRDEANVADNTRLIEIQTTTATVHDIRVASCKVVGGSLAAGGHIVLEVTIANLGNEEEKGIVINGLFSGDAFESPRLLDLATGGIKTLSYDWPIPNETIGPNDLAPVYALAFKAIPTATDCHPRDNEKIIKFGVRREDDSVTPLHATGDNYSQSKYVHQWIALEAYNYFTNEISGSDLTPYMGTISGSFGDGDNNVLEGTCDEDISGENPEAWYTEYNLLGPYIDHFCAGADGAEIYDGLGAWNAALTRASWYWSNYVTPKYASNKAQCFYYLGHVVHLLTDMTVPAHVHNDDHVTGDAYEDGMAFNNQFKLWYYGCARSGDWGAPLSVFTNLHEVFYRTANYVEDYDSDDKEGDAPPFYDPADYYDANHQPASVDRAGGFTGAELACMGDDLMPYAMRRVADLYRTFYCVVDASGPTVTLGYPTSEDADNPTVRNTSLAFDVSATASDAQSGYLVQGFQYRWAYWTGSEWSSWADMSPSPAGASVAFTPSQGETVYAFYVIGENGGGRQAASAVKYLRITNSPPDAPTLSSPADGAYGQSLTPTLEASVFIDADGDGHANSQWQVDDDAGFAGPEWDSGEAYVAGTQATVPAGLLGGNTTYNWRVRYKDSRGAWSDWSTPGYFTTEDGDGMPDAWEIFYFGSTAALPGDDADRDGFTNIQEHWAGTDPTSHGSKPCIASISSEGRDILIRFESVVGRRYWLQKSDDLIIWTPLTETNGTGAPIEIRDIDVRGDVARRFYRILIGPE